MFNNTMEILKLLPKTNCKKCMFPTCLAFAVATFKGERNVKQCPYFDSDIAGHEHDAGHVTSMDQEFQKLLEPLKRQASQIDFSNSLERLGAGLSDKSLVINSLGKDFYIDPEGNIVSACHVHSWVTVPLLNYIISSAGRVPTGQWIPFRELNDGVSWGPLFADQFEIPLKQVVDSNPDLFAMMTEIFSGKPEPSPVGADISVRLDPLPKFPILICYWKPIDGLDSFLKVLLDSTAGDNLNVESIFTLCVGLMRMFSKVADSHVR